MAEWFRSWWGPRVPDQDIGRPVILMTTETAVPETFLAAVKTKMGEPVEVRMGPGGDCEPDAGAVRRLLAKMQPARLVILGVLPVPAAVFASLGVPLTWISAEQADAGQSGATLITVRSPEVAKRLPQAVVTGDPLLAVPVRAKTDDTALCERFKEIRDRDRWVLYFSGTEEGEENLAYSTFLQLSRRGVGLLALAPFDPERYEPVYREAMRFHLMTNRHGRLMTSFIPHKTRVYYIEDPGVRLAMHRCVDVVVAGGTFLVAGVAPEVIEPMMQGRPVLVGPLAHNPLITAAIADGALVAADPAQIEAPLTQWLAEAPARLQQGERGRAWIDLQCGAAERVLALLN